MEIGRVGNVAKKKSLWPNEDAQKSAASYHRAACRDADMVHLVAGGAGFRQRSTRNHFAVVGGSLVEIHDREKIRVLARLIAGTDEQMPGRAAQSLRLGLRALRMHGGCAGNHQQHADTKKSHGGESCAARAPGFGHVRGLRPCGAQYAGAYLEVLCES